MAQRVTLSSRLPPGGTPHDRTTTVLIAALHPVADWLAGNFPAVLAGVAVPAVTFAAVRRQRSGQVSSSEATDLWRESGEIRRELRGEIAAVNERVRVLTIENEQLRRDMHALRAENETLRAQCARCALVLRGPSPEDDGR
jgi:hypothetical protein